ncbi:cyclic nucleotide-binding domain-containing protein [Limnohabitans sp.]|uniref:cyclic nucleotide-binding domain-containing protein n=1 Tax=Limnohabitans sp. TaxID=1907725 RepID=UPI00286F898C|nr:cyclic nucleotide-binding domain-containing protein [Limnohabitans sp.]
MSAEPNQEAPTASRTPKTDAVERFMHTPGRPPVGFVLSEFARRMEYELRVAIEVANGRATLADLERVQKLNVKSLPSRAAAPVRAVVAPAPSAPTRKASADAASQAGAAAPRVPRRKVSSEGAGESIVYEEGKVLFNQGDKADHLAIILEGSVEIFDAKTGNSIAVLNKGVSFGEQAILEGGVRGASARAHTRVVCLEISTEPLRAILKSDPGILTPVVEAMLLQLNMANKISKSVDSDELDYEVTNDNNLSSTQVQKILDEVYATGDNKGMSSDELMFLKLLASNKLHTTVHEAGTVLGSPDDTELGLGYIIVQGHVEAAIGPKKYKLGPGSVLGLAEALLDKTLPWALTSLDTVTLMNIPIDKALRGLEHANPGIRGIVRYTADRIMHLQNTF